jgi:MFS family permease
VGSEAGETRVGVRTILADRRVGVVVLLAFVLMLGTGIVLPILPLFARSFGGGYDDAGVFIASFSAARLVADLLGGRLIDHVGERLAGVGGLALLGLACVLTSTAPSFVLAATFWAGAGVGSAVVFAAMYSQLLRVVPQARMARTLSVFYGAFNAGIVAGGFGAGVIADRLGVESPLLFAAGVAVLSALLYLRFIPARGAPSAPEQARGGERVGAAAILRTPGFLMVLATQFAYLWLVVAVFDTLLPLYADSLGMSTIGIGVVFGVSLATEFAVLYPAGHLADSRGRRFVLVPALLALGVATAAVGWTGSPLVLGVAMALLGVASGFAGVPPGAMLADVMPQGSSGTAVGIFRFAGDLGFLLGPLAAGFGAAHLGFKAAFALASVPTVVALAAVLRGQETLPATPRPVVEPLPAEGDISR